MRSGSPLLIRWSISSATSRVDVIGAFSFAAGSESRGAEFRSLLMSVSALGVAVGALVRLLLGVPARGPDPADDAAATAPDARRAA